MLFLEQSAPVQKRKASEVVPAELMVRRIRRCLEGHIWQQWYTHSAGKSHLQQRGRSHLQQAECLRDEIGRLVDKAAAVELLLPSVGHEHAYSMVAFAHLIAQGQRYSLTLTTSTARWPFCGGTRPSLKSQTMS
jgi:hypothetical protein